MTFYHLFLENTLYSRVNSHTLSKINTVWFFINLEKSVKCEKDVQVIGLASVVKKCDVTLLVISTFFI